MTLDGPLADQELAQVERTLDERLVLSVFVGVESEADLTRLLLRLARTERRRRQFAPIGRPRMAKAPAPERSSDG